MSMLTIITENAPPRLRGRLSLLLLEVRAGVYVGVATLKVREQLWSIVESHIEAGSAVLVWPDPDNATGVMFKTTGPNRRLPITLDGLTLVQFATVLDEAKISVAASSVENMLYDNGLEEVSAPRERG